MLIVASQSGKNKQIISDIPRSFLFPPQVSASNQSSASAQTQCWMLKASVFIELIFGLVQKKRNEKTSKFCLKAHTICNKRLEKNLLIYFYTMDNKINYKIEYKNRLKLFYFFFHPEFVVYLTMHSCVLWLTQ